MPKLTPVDIDPFNVGMSEALPAPQAKLRAKELFGGFGKAFMSGLQDAGRAGATSMMEALENQYVPEGAVGINDAGQWTDKQGNPLNVQRRPNIVPLTKTAEGGYEGAMPAMADVWNTMGGVGRAATLGAGPVLRPALKYKDKIYKAKEGQQHLDALPVELQDTFQKMAMSGEDISHFNFGFINHKGQFLTREKALEYAINEGMLDPQDAKYGTLVTTMLNDSGAGGKLTSQAIQAIRDNKTKFELDSEAFINKNNLPKLSNDQIISNMLSRIRSIEYDRRLSGKPEDGYPYNHELSTLRKRVKELKLLNDSGGGQKVASQAAAQSREMKYPLAKHEDWWGQRQYDQQGGRMETMSPDEFLNKSRPLKIDESSRENIEELKQHILSGKTLDPLNLQQGGKEDGRHRAIAAKELGIKEVPVINFRPTPTFYSATEKAVENLNQNKASGEQWINTLSNQKGVKGEELEWTGLKEFLKDKPSVTKQEIQEYLKNNKVELQEVWKGGDTDSAYKQFLKDNPEPHTSNPNYMDWLEKRDNYLDKYEPPKTKYHNYQLPGGENYRELLLTFPVKTSKEGDAVANFAKAAREAYGERWVAEAPYGIRQQYEELIARQERLGLEAAENQNYKSSHWDEPNPLVHMRMNDRTIDGKKSLHLEEIQSDWHQQGREKGYYSSKSKAEFDRLNKEFEDARSDLGFATEKKANELLGMSYQKYRAMYPAEKDDALKKLKEYRAQDLEYVALEKKVEELEKARNAVNPSGGVPDAPFKKTWHELALKRAIREAAENGYERLSWTPGEAQALRYPDEMRKAANSIEWHNKKIGKVDADGNKQILIDMKDGSQLELGINKEGIVITGIEKAKGKSLSEIIGKDMAKDILNKDEGNIAGKDFIVGGEGMKGFYDQIIPKSIEKIAKEFGVKVQKGEIKTYKENELAKKLKENDYDPDNVNIQQILEDNGGRLPKWLTDEELTAIENGEHLEFKGLKKEPIFYIDIPPTMRQSIVGKGQPLFSGTPTLTPIDYQPEFEEETK